MMETLTITDYLRIDCLFKAMACSVVEKRFEEDFVSCDMEEKKVLFKKRINIFD